MRVIGGILYIPLSINVYFFMMIYLVSRSNIYGVEVTDFDQSEDERVLFAGTDRI